MFFCVDINIFLSFAAIFFNQINMKNLSNFTEKILLPFLHSINRFSNRNAFCIAGQFYTYEQFGNHIANIRCIIQQMQIPDTVCLVANDTIETYAAIFALWLEGKSYVALNPNQPFERNEIIIKQIDSNFILDSNKDSQFTHYKLISLNSLNNVCECSDYKTVSDEQRAYILFTSGSTGIPKGVEITLKNLSAFVQAFEKTEIIITENDRCLQCFDLTFDVSVQSFLLPLLKGACVYTVPHNQLKFKYVYELLHKHKLTFGAMTPSMLRFLQPYFNKIYLESFRCCILTAEASSEDFVSQWSKSIPNAKIYNFYGPTEGTIYCIYYPFEREKENQSHQGMLAIGKPMEGITAILIDEQKNEVLCGEKGELCIAGNQITKGYWNEPKKTDESFFYQTKNNKKLKFYRTGDICSLTKDGNFLLYGRNDYQVKIQGYRIELGEVEYHARAFVPNANLVALSFENKMNNTEIALIIEGKDFETKDLKDYLHKKLPPYMLPCNYYFVPKFPVNNSEKLDRVSLKKMIFNNE